MLLGSSAARQVREDDDVRVQACEARDGAEREPAPVLGHMDAFHGAAPAQEHRHVHAHPEGGKLGPPVFVLQDHGMLSRHETDMLSSHQDLKHLRHAEEKIFPYRSNSPKQYAVGVEHVLVNGVPVIRHGEHTGAKPGRVVRGPGYRP